MRRSRSSSATNSTVASTLRIIVYLSCVVIGQPSVANQDCKSLNFSTNVLILSIPSKISDKPHLFGNLLSRLPVRCLEICTFAVKYLRETTDRGENTRYNTVS